MRSGWLFVLASVLLGGCALMQPAPPVAVPQSVPGSVDEALQHASSLAAEGHWAEVFAMLDATQKAFPGDERVVQRREQLQLRREGEGRVLEDQILLGDAESLKNKIALLERLSRVQPDNLIVLSRRLYWKEVLEDKTLALTDCAEFHAGGETALARRCFNLASELPTTAAIDQRLAVVSEALRSSENIAAERRRAREQKVRQQRARTLLAEAKAAIEQQRYRTALDILDQVAALQPDNSEVPELQQAAWSMISPQVEALIKLGDHLYLNEQLGAALGTWQAALTLKPGDEEIVTRIERARTVLNRLETLRQQQKTPGGTP